MEFYFAENYLEVLDLVFGLKVEVNKEWFFIEINLSVISTYLYCQMLINKIETHCIDFFEIQIQIKLTWFIIANSLLNWFQKVNPQRRGYLIKSLPFLYAF